jgi:hypothetical protein
MSDDIIKRLREAIAADFERMIGTALTKDITALLDRLDDFETNGAMAVRWAPSSAHWSNELRRLFGSDAREGIDNLERRLRYQTDRLNAAERENERLREFERSAALTLPGVYYMDPPDGGDVSLLKQLQRMSNDAARYRLLRRKFAIISDGEGNAEFCPINLPRPTYIAPRSAIELDTALDRERLGLDGAERPPTPAGWSDADWIKHLQEQDEQPHPLAGQHINQGSLDAAAADAYEAEYHDALKQDAERYRLIRRGQRWSVIDGIGDSLRAERLDAAIDAAIDAARATEQSDERREA